MVLKKLNVMNSAMIALVVSVAVWVLNWIIGLAGINVTQLFSISPVSPVTATAGGKVLGVLGGVIPNFDFAGLVMLFVSAFVIVWVGAFVKDLGLPTYEFRKNKKASDIFWMLVYGNLVFYVVVVGFVLQAWQTYLGFALYTLVVSLTAAYIADPLGISV